jgi:hypothetical protein
MLDVDDLYPEHPKLVGLGTWCEVAGWLNLAALCWCKRYLTDGVLPRQTVWRLAIFRGMTIDGEPVTPEAVAAKLVEATLWAERGPCYVIHDFLAYQESRAAVLERRAADRKRKAATSQHSSTFRPDSARNPSGVLPESGAPLPLPLPEEDPDARARSSSDAARAQNKDRSRTRRGIARVEPPTPRGGQPSRLGDILAAAVAKTSGA